MIVFVKTREKIIAVTELQEVETLCESAGYING